MLESWLKLAVMTSYLERPIVIAEIGCNHKEQFAQFEIDEESDWIVAENLHQKYILS